MKTDDFLRLLAHDTAPQRPVAFSLAVMLVASGALSLAGVVSMLGVRPDPGEALLEIRVAVKQIWPVFLAVAAGGAALGLACPGRRVAPWLIALAAIPLFLCVAVAVEMRLVPASDWRQAMMGETAAACLALVTTLSAPLLAGVLWALSRGASVRPALSGALAGLLSGGTAASLYALHCTEDSPMFYTVWYVAAILLVTAAGAGIGRKCLRW